MVRERSGPRSAGTMQKARVVAPDRDRDPRVVPHPALRGQRGGEHLERLEQLDDRQVVGVGAGEQVGEVTEVVGAVDDVDPGRALGDRRAVLLREAAADDDREVAALVASRVLDALEVTERPVEPLVGVLPHGAGVEQDEVRVQRVRGPAVADRLEDPGGTLRVVLVHLAAEGPHRVGAGTVTDCPWAGPRSPSHLRPDVGTGAQCARARLRTASPRLHRRAPLRASRRTIAAGSSPRSRTTVARPSGEPEQGHHEPGERAGAPARDVHREVAQPLRGRAGLERERGGQQRGAGDERGRPAGPEEQEPERGTRPTVRGVLSAASATAATSWANPSPRTAAVRDGRRAGRTPD
jgi:hypothetical protein